MKFNNVELTQETIIKTRQHFADNAQCCINEVLDGSVKLPDHVSNEDYFSDCRKRAERFLTGGGDHTFTFLQRAYWIQTGEMVALLP